MFFQSAVDLTEAERGVLTTRQTCLKTKHKSLQRCLPTLQAACDQSKVRSSKILRARMTAMRNVLQQDKDILIIHIIRDPRGTIMSRKSVNLLSRKAGKNMQREGKILCNQMMEDIKVRKELEKTFPRSFLQIRYEDLAERLEETLRQVYSHINMPYEERVHQKMLSIMYSGKTKKGGGFSQHRGNASSVAHAWRTRISAPLKETMDKNCRGVYETFGYAV